MKSIINSIIFWLVPGICFAQQYYLKGRVTDEAGNALQNVSILLHSTGYKYATGTEGGYGILTNRITDTLTFFHEGFVKEKIVVRATAFLELQLKRVAFSTSSSINKLASQTQNLKREVQQKWFAGEETYASLVENSFINADDYPLTSVSLNVDRASYSNVRRFLKANAIVPPDAVRINEMLNYFNVNYTPPSQGQTFFLQSTLTDCPWNKRSRLLFVQANAKKLNFEILPPTHLVFLIDVSGSMDMPNRLPLVKSGFKLLVENLRSMDTVSMVVYGGSVGIALPATGGDEKQKIYAAIDSLQPGGFTPGASGIKVAYKLAKEHFIENGNNRIILATDGDFNVGLQTEDELEKLITIEKERGIYLSCLGIGMGNYKDSKIQLLARRGNGNFAYLDSFAEAEKVLMQEFASSLYVVADNAVLNVTFDPAQVKQYRLIGYDNKYKAVLDSASVVEGGEVGSGYSNLLAFELLMHEGYNKADLNFSIRYKDPGSDEWSEFDAAESVGHIKFSALPVHYQLAAAVIMYGGMLKQSKFVKPSWKELGAIARAAADPTVPSQKEFLELIEQAKKIYTGKRRK